MKKKSKRLLFSLKHAFEPQLFSKAFFFIFLLGVILVNPVFAQEKKVTMKYEKISLEDVIWNLKKQTGLKFVYSTDDVKDIVVEKLDVSNASVEEVLNTCLVNTKLTFQKKGKTIIIVKKIVNKQPKKSEPVLDEEQKTEISGKVTDKEGYPLPGATILEKGTMNGVTTDEKGQFKFSVSDQASFLLVSYVGFEAKEIAIDGQTVFNVVLEESTSLLGEVVVTGYQTISKERATGSYGIVTEEDLDKKLNTDLVKMIEGMTTGLVTDEEGNITIRGLSTFGNQDPDYYYTEEEIALDRKMKSPLIVLDGFPYDGDLSSINSDNIANITVLKDGVAASIYGSRSANGVIVVTSKKGKRTDFTVSYKGTFSITKKTDIKDFHLSSTSDYIDGKIAQYESAPYYFYHDASVREAPVDYILADVSEGSKTMEQALTEIERYRSLDAYSQLQEYALQNQFTQQHNISIRGGGEKNLFNASINFLDHKGEEILSKDNRFIVDINNIWNPTDFITFSTSANIVYKKEDRSATSVIEMITDAYSGYHLEPYDVFVDESGNSIGIENWVNPARIAVYNTYSGLKDASYNPLEDMGLGMVSTTDMQTRLSANLKVGIMKGLNVTVGGAWTRGNTNKKTEYEANSFKVRIGYNETTSIPNPTKHYLPEGGIIDENRGFNESYTIRTQVNFDKSFAGDKHRMRLLLGNEVRKETYNHSELATRVGYNSTSGDFIFIDNSTFNPRYSSEGSDYLGGLNANVPSLSTGSYTLRDNRYVSWYGNGSYEFDDRFIFSGSIRMDLTNIFGTDPKYRHRPLWSLGGTYKLSNEEWFNVNWINRLNVRASYGINGNIAFPEGPFMILKSNGYSQVAQGVAYGVQSPPNNQLRWEKTATSNFGVDLTVLDNRISLAVDYYFKKSSDILAPDAVDRTTGVSSLAKNAGKITNKGIEIALNADVIKTKDFKYDISLNISHNKNMVDEYNVNRAYSSYYLMEETGMAEAGYAMNSVWGFAEAPLSAEGESQTYNAAGELIHPDNVEKEDLVYMGTLTPTTNIAWTNSFTYKNFDVSFMFVGSFGAVMWMDAFNGSNIENRHVAEAWKVPGDELKTIYPKASLWGDGWWPNKGEQFIASADYVKLRDLTITYNFPEKWMKKIGLKRGKLYLQGRNLFRLTAKGVDIDPETRGLPLKAEFYTGISFEF